MRKSIIIGILLLSSVAGFSQSTELTAIEPKLTELLNNLRSAESDDEKAIRNEAFKTELRKALELPGAIDYPFSSLSTVGVIDSPDKQMRIVNWNVEQDDMSHTYNCIVMHKDDRRDRVYVTELMNDPMQMPMPSEIISSENWYGALYYKIIPVKKGRRTLYTVLGWDYLSSMSQMKLIDVIYFTGSTVKLGNPVFKEGDETKNRVFFEHSKKATMTLRYEKERDRIIFDHLSPESPSMKNFRSFYLPDMSYDAFVFEKTKWVLKEDVIGINNDSSSKKQVVYVLNDKTGKVEPREMKSEWIDPTDLNAPGGGSEHVAVTPESAAEQAEKEKEYNEPEANKKDKRDPSQLSFYKDLDKNKKRNRRKKKK